MSEGIVKILIVDDEANMREYLSDALQDEGNQLYPDHLRRTKTSARGKGKDREGSQEEALQEIESGLGDQFDPQIGKLFISAIKNNGKTLDKG